MPPPGMVAFRCADTHLHLLLPVGRQRAGEVVRRIEIALGGLLQLSTPFEGARFRPVLSQSHLANAFEYILRQDTRHGFCTDPFHDASILPDILGLRVLGPPVLPSVREQLPRLSWDKLMAFLGVGCLDERLSRDGLSEAAAAAAGLPDIRGSSRESVLARAAVVAAAAGCIPRHELAALLGRSERDVRRARRAADPRLIRAIKLQLDFRERLRGGAPEPGIGDASSSGAAAPPA